MLSVITKDKKAPQASSDGESNGAGAEDSMSKSEDIDRPLGPAGKDGDTGNFNGNIPPGGTFESMPAPDDGFDKKRVELFKKVDVYKKSDITKLYETYCELVTLSDQSGRFQFEARYDLAGFQRDYGNDRESFKLLRKALTYEPHKDSFRYKYEAHAQLGDYELILDLGLDLESAQKSARAAYKFAKALDHAEKITYSASNLAKYHAHKGEFEKAVSFQEEAISKSQSDNLIAQKNYYQDLFNYQIKAKMYEPALVSAKKLVDLALIRFDSESDNQAFLSELSSCIVNYAGILMHQKEYGLANSQLEKLFTIATESGLDLQDQDSYDSEEEDHELLIAGIARAKLYKSICIYMIERESFTEIVKDLDTNVIIDLNLHADYSVFDQFDFERLGLAEKEWIDYLESIYKVTTDISSSTVFSMEINKQLGTIYAKQDLRADAEIHFQEIINKLKDSSEDYDSIRVYYLKAAASFFSVYTDEVEKAANLFRDAIEINSEIYHAYEPELLELYLDLSNHYAINQDVIEAARVMDQLFTMINSEHCELQELVSYSIEAAERKFEVLDITRALDRVIEAEEKLRELEEDSDSSDQEVTIKLANLLYRIHAKILLHQGNIPLALTKLEVADESALQLFKNTEYKELRADSAFELAYAHFMKNREEQEESSSQPSTESLNQASHALDLSRQIYVELGNDIGSIKAAALGSMISEDSFDFDQAKDQALLAYTFAKDLETKEYALANQAYLLTVGVLSTSAEHQKAIEILDIAYNKVKEFAHLNPFLIVDIAHTAVKFFKDANNWEYKDKILEYLQIGKSAYLEVKRINSSLHYSILGDPKIENLKTGLSELADQFEINFKLD